MRAIATLLPGLLGPSPRAVDRVGLDALKETADLAELLRTLWDPYACPASELKLLAWAWSVEVFKEWWPEARKRQTIAESRRFHRLKTTVAGTRMALGYEDARLVRAHLPRHGIFCDRAVSPAEQAAWLERLPEIRVYDAGPHIRPHRSFGFAGRNVAQPDARRARLAVLVRDGVETALQSVPNEDPRVPGARFVLPLVPLGCNIVGRAGTRAVAPNELPLKALAVRYGAAGDSFARPLATPGDLGTFIQTRRRQIEGTADVPMTAVGRGGMRICAPVAIARGYLSLKFSDEPGRLTPHRPLNVVGYSRVRPAPYSAHFLVKWERVVARSSFPPGRRVVESSQPVVLGLMEAVLSASPLRDRNLISLSATRRLTYADARTLKRGMRYGDRRDLRA